MSLRNGVAEKEVKGRTRASSQRAANNSRTEPNTISPKAHKGIPTATKPSPKPQPPPKLNHSNSAKPHISDKPHPPQVTPVKSTKAPSKVTPNPPEQFVCKTCAILTSSPNDIREAVADIKEALLETKIQTSGLTLQTRHLIVDPKRSLETLGEQASRVASLCKTVEDRFEKFQKLLTLQFRSLTSKVDNLLLAPDHSDKLVMLSAKFDQLDSKINSIMPVTDPTEGIIRGVKALLNEQPTPPFAKPAEIIEGVAALLDSMTPAPTPQPLASLELLTQRLDDLAAENKRLADAAREAIDTSCKAIALKMSHHNDRVMEVITQAPPTASPIVNKNPPPFLPALENVLDIIFKSPLVKNLDPISSSIENFAPELHESLLDLCNELEFTAEGGHKVSTQGAPYHYWRHALNDKSSKSTPMHAIIIALINYIKQAFPNCPLPNSCLVNMFDGPDAYLPEHEDNEKCLDPSSNIYTFSLGDLMKILFSSSLDSDAEEHEFTATHGSLYVMSVASQALWRHRIEQCAAFTGRRFSITLRTVDERFRKSTVILGDSNTKYINFGEGNGSLGYGVPGKRVEAMKVGHIDPLACAGYSNVIIHCGLNDLKSNQPQPHAVFNQLLSTTQAIRLVCPRARICVSPILPSKIPIINESALAFNQLLFKHIQSEAKPSITSVDLNCFLDHRSGCLRTELGRYMSSDPFHLGRDGYRLLANVFKDMILGASYGLNRRASGAGFRPDTGGSGRGNTRVSGSVSGRGSGGSGRRSQPVTPLHHHSSQYTYS